MTALDHTTASPGSGDAATRERLVARYAEDGREAELVHATVTDTLARLADARVTAFVPVLVERAVRRALPA